MRGGLTDRACLLVPVPGILVTDDFASFGGKPP